MFCYRLTWRDVHSYGYCTLVWWSDAVSLTGVQTCPRSAPPLSCSGRTPCAARPPRSSAPCSRAPGTPLSRWSGSPLTCGRPGSAWQPRCSSSSAASTSRPGGGGQRGTIVRETQDSVVISHTVLARVGACGLHADDSTVWGHLHRLLWVPFFFFYEQMSPNTDKVSKMADSQAPLWYQQSHSLSWGPPEEENNNLDVARLLSHCESQVLFGEMIQFVLCKSGAFASAVFWETGWCNYSPKWFCC